MSDAPESLDDFLAAGAARLMAKLRAKKPREAKASKRAAPERDAQKAVVAWLRKAGCIVSATQNERGARSRDKDSAARFGAMRKASGVMTGWPDLTVVAPTGRVFFIEMKSAKGKPSAAQVECHALLRSRGQVVIVGRDIWQIQHDLDQAGITLVRTGWCAPVPAERV